MPGYTFESYSNGRLRVSPVSVDLPAVSDQWIDRDSFFAPANTDLRESGLFTATRIGVEDNGKHYRLWRLTAKGKRALKASAAA